MKKICVIILMYAGLFLFPLNLLAIENGNEQPDKKDSTSDQSETIEKKKEDKYKNPLGITAFRPNYILIANYTSKPYNTIYRNYTLDGRSLKPNAHLYGYNTPDGKPVSKLDCKFQISILLPIINKLIFKDLSLNAAYTQVNFWQIYKKAPYFRETSFEPEFFLRYLVTNHIATSLGVTHQSNGRGGSLERSWNRTYIDLTLMWEHWLVNIKGWIPIFTKGTLKVHNPDIMKYMGYGHLLVAFKISRLELSFQGYNFIESRFRRGSFQITTSFRIFKYFSLYFNYLNGYGQSMVEFNHRCHSLGIGMSANNLF